MAKQLNVNMSFTADSSQARKQLQELQGSLNKLMGASKIDLGLNDEIQSAIKSTAELSAHLQHATNIKTGNLDFAKLNQSIKASGKTLTQYGRSLQELGPTGQQAFMQLTQAVAQSEIPFRRTNALVKEFATTLANTARWQLSSSVLHGFMGTLQSAYGYAQDLNESLNNIRIVTGNSVDDMAKFASEANKAAKALSTTTTAYTNASLIYYQQGLSDEQVKKRADITIKLANVSRQSADEVSSQMTAIWNNFYNGSQSLEHYADVLAALGAATASSTEEIAGGLEKFAAIADTIGLSYEYAAAALATLTSNTRESEEVVGTALKTIFARIQGLSLGETLDDGTTLNKYSQALATVGINIKDANGGLKDMDVLLDEMGAKWNTLNRDQQTALAQTVAGTRQYNQLMALMANWNNGDSDSFKANLATAKDADGTLQKQAETYAEGWEAAADRVKAAAEEIYQKLINDDFFIDLLNNIEKILEFISTIIDRVGGLRGVLLSLGTIVTKVFSQQISQGLSSMAYNMQMMTKAGRKKVEDEREAFLKSAARDMADSATDKGGGANSVAADIYTQQLTQQQALLENAEHMTEIEKHTVQMLMDQLKLRGELAIEKAKERDAAEATVEASETKIYTAMKTQAQKSHKKFDQEGMQKQLHTVKESATTTTAVSDILAQAKAEGRITQEQIAAIKQAYLDLRATTEDGLYDEHDQKSLEGMLHYLGRLNDDASAFGFELDKIQQKVEGMDIAVQDGAADALKGVDPEDIRTYASAIRSQTQAENELTEAQKNVTESSETVNKAIKESSGVQKTWADHLVATANVAMSAASAITMLGSVVDTLNDPDMSGWQKFTAILTTMTMLIPTLITLWTSFKTLLGQETLVKLGNVAATLAQAAAERKLNKEKGVSSDTTKKSIKETFKDTGKKLKETGKQGIEKIKGGWGKVKDSVTAKRDAFNKNTWDKLDGKTKSKYMSDYFKNNKDGVTKVTEKGVTKYMQNGKTISKGQASKLASKGAMKTAGAKAAGSMAGGAALIAAGIAVAVGAVAWGVAQFKKYAKAAEEAAKVAADAAENYEKVAAAYESFKANMNDYKTAKDGLKDLTKGTVEYQEAVMNANKAAQELIDKGDLKLGVDYEIDSDGLIQLNEDSVNAARKKELEQVSKAQMAAQITQQRANQAKTESDKVDFLRQDVKSTSGFMLNAGNVLAATGAGAGSGALIGTGIGTIFPGIGNAVGAAAGAIIGGAIGLTTGLIGASKSGSSSEREKEAMDKLAAEYASGKVDEKTGKTLDAMTDEEYANYLKTELQINDSALVKSLTENRDEAKKLCDEMNKNSEATKALNKQIAASALSDNNAVQNSDYTDEIVATTGKLIEDDKQKALDDMKDWGTKGVSWASGKNDKDAQKVLQEYAEAAGLEGIELSKVKGTDKNRKFVYKDADGKEHTVDLDTMKDVVASSRAADAANTRGTELAKIYNNFNKEEMAAVNAAVNGNYDKLNISQFKNGITSVTAQSLGLSAEELKTMGYDSADAFNAAMAEAQKNAAADWDKTLRSHTSGVDQAMNAIASSTNDGLQNISYSTLKAYGDMLEGFGNSAEATNFSNALTGIMEANSEDAEKIMQAATGIDWSQGQVALDQFNGQLYDMGIDIENNTELWNAFQNAVNNMSFSVVHQNLATMRETLASISKIAKDVSVGDVVSDEDYEKLTSVDGSLKKDFVMTADGYMYVGEGNLQNKAKDATVNQLKKSKSNNEKAAAAYNALQQGSFYGEDWTGLIDGTDGDAASISMAQQLAANSDITSALGVDAAYINELVAAMQGTDTVAKDAAREKLKALYGDIQTLEDNYDAGLYDNTRAEEVAASQMGLKDLQSAFDEGSISKDVYEKFKAVLEKKESEVELEEAERYHAINEELEGINHELTKTGKLKDQAFGAQKVKQIEAETTALKKQIQAQKDYQNEIKTNLASDKKELTDAGYGFTFNTDGSISNYDAIYNKYLNEWNEAQKDNATGDITAEDFEAAQKKWEEFKENVSQYEDSLDLFKTSEESLLDMQAQLSASNLEKITYTLDYKVEIDDRELKWLDYQLGKMADDFYSKAESAMLMIGTIGEDGSLTLGGKLGTIIDNKTDYQTAKSDLDAKYAAGELTQADYQAGLNRIFDDTMNNIDAITELDKSMLSYYGETLAAANEELGKYTERMEHHNSVLNHYKNLLGIIGEESDFESMGVILEGSAQVAANSLKVSTEAYDMYMNEANKWADKMKDAVEGSAEFEMYKKNWEEAEAMARESQDKMLSDLAAWAEAEKAVLQNTLSNLGQTLEESLTGGLSFDKLSTQMERAQSLQEEYLTTTNQIYETTKMMRTAQQAIDASSNTVAKEKLKNFITETKSLQEQGKLSQYELDMQQAKYDLLVAEIALEEAQNAKSTVRLQRDSEGNLGYVYTADAGAVSEAQQQFDDAQNALYNKGLEGANDYTQKYQQTMSEMTDTLKQIQEDYLNGSFASEAEYQAAMEEAKAFYFEKLQGYSQLYGVALSADSAIAAEAWSTDFAGMVNNTEEWKVKVDDYIKGATEAFNGWSEVVATVKETTGKDLTELASNVSSITTANTALADELTNDEDGVIKAMQEELTEVGNLTTAYGTYRQAVLDTISALETLASTTKNNLTTLTVTTTTDTNTSTNTPDNSTSTSGASGGGAPRGGSGGGFGAAAVTVAAYDTGGYTGEWGPEGKIAMLHEKELVLGQDDTTNFLHGMQLLDSILATIETYALNQQLGGALSSPDYVNNSSDTLEQNVKIEASFPSVTDRNEIEEAFNNLVNKASQYANRK